MEVIEETEEEGRVERGRPSTMIAQPTLERQVDAWLDEWNWPAEEERLSGALREDLWAAAILGWLTLAVRLQMAGHAMPAVDMATLTDRIESSMRRVVGEILQTTRAMWRAALLFYLRTSSMTRDALRRLLVEGGEGDRAGILPIAVRAELIASTELTRARTLALLLAARASGLAWREAELQPPLHPRCRCFLQPFQNASGALSWRWLTADDERVCATCAPLHGKDVGAGGET